MIDSKASLREYLDTDLRAAGLAAVPRLARLRYPALYFVRQLRRVEYLKNTKRTLLGQLQYAIFRYRLAKLSERLGFSIPLNVFGPGLSIAHVGTIVVNGGAQVGSFCRLHPGVTIGATRGLAPRIGDRVFLAPGAGVYGGIEVGDNCRVGPNVVVATSLPAGTMAYPSIPKLGEVTLPWTQELLSYE